MGRILPVFVLFCVTGFLTLVVDDLDGENPGWLVGAIVAVIPATVARPALVFVGAQAFIALCVAVVWGFDPLFAHRLYPGRSVLPKDPVI